MQQPPWMAVAWAELGQSERPGPASNPRIIDYFRRVGHPSVVDDETAWCAAFVGTCLEQAGFDSTRSLAARSYLAWGEPDASPGLGALVVLSRGDNPALGHVGFLIGMTENHVMLLGGNQTDAVGLAAFDRRRIIGVRKPAADAIPKAAHDAPAFEVALAHVLVLEGGWSDDPLDPGGPTNKGITLADLARERRLAITEQSYPALLTELRQISDQLVRDIYRNRYWRAARCADLPAALALMHFDAAVNQGVTGAARMLQRALGVAVDGEIGPITLGAARNCNVAATLEAYAAVRRRRYRALPTFWRFGRGWLRRVDATLARAHRLARPADVPPANPEQESPMPDSQANLPSSASHGRSVDAIPEVKWWGQSMTIWGALLTALSTVLPVLGPALGLNLTAELVQRLGQDVFLLVQAAGGLIGTVMTILGRVRASAQLMRRPMQLKL
jgi:uncharacterized protein (TIGR02594 family)